MPLTPGTRLGPFEIVAPLGAGGMGEVYKATDTRLDRIVAIKVLPSHVAANPEAKQRFEREAKTLAALSHPHICPVFDMGQHDGTDFLVMEYLDGETLADRLAKGSLTLDLALRYAIEIADALDKAHRTGIVHRDLKPGNIMLTRSGGSTFVTKLLDFGLARVLVTVPAGGPSMAATITSPLTGHGAILGTLQYMAPEQLEGKEADARTDIFAFGAVLYEMLTGSRPFEGTSQASLISSIMTTVPRPVSAVQPLAPRSLDRIVERCLAKDPDARWQTARDLLEELKWIAADGERAAPAPTGAPRRNRGAAIVTATSLLVATAAVAVVLYLRPPVPEPLVSRLDVVTPPTSDPFSFALSHEGRQVVFVAANADGVSRLWVRPLDQATPRPIVGTERASYPFWSPDGRAIGFFADSKLKSVDVAGGAARVHADVPGARGGTWNRDGVIVFAPQQAGLMRIAATGGTPTPLTQLRAGEGSHRWPQFLPDGRQFLFFVGVGQPSTFGVYLGSLDSSEPVRLLAGETAAAFATPGFVLRVEEGVLVAHRFDAVRGVVSNESVPLAQPVGADDGTFHSAFSVSETGVLAYRPGGLARRQLVWVDRTGKVTSVVTPPDDASPSGPELASDGRRVAVFRTLPGQLNDIYLVDAARSLSTRFTFDPGVDAHPVWSPDGSRLIFASTRNGKWDLFEKPASQATGERPLLVTAEDKVPLDWSPDGRVLLYMSRDPQTGASDLWALPLTSEPASTRSTSSGPPAPVEGPKAFPVVHRTADEREGQFSPDGRWVAYVSNETGTDEVYVVPFPGPGGTWQISSGGGTDPRWRRDGQELFYVAPDSKLMAASIQLGADGHVLNQGSPMALFPTRLATGANITVGFNSKPQYAVARDGLFLMNVTVDEPTSSPITLVLNWPALLKK